MKKEKKVPGTGELRRRAEETLRGQPVMDNKPTSDNEAIRMLHELQVQQVELQMQDDELLNSRTALESALARFTDFYEFSPVGNFSIDHNGVIIRTNLAGARMLGVERIHLPGRRLAEFLEAADQAACGVLLRQVFDGKGAQTFELKLVRDKQPPLFVQISGTLSDDASECRAVMMDISERKQIELELATVHARLEQRVEERTADLRAANVLLEKALHARDEFLSAMSHELRAPLTGVLGLAQVLQLQSYGPLVEKQITAIKMIETSGKRLLELVNDILDYSTIQSGTFTLDKQLCSLGEICQAALDRIKPEAAQKQQQSSFEISPEVIFLRADALRLNKTIMLLLSNASKFTLDGGSFGIKATGSPDETQITISVWDTGIGISSKDVSRLFQPFVQLDARLSREYYGAGLGLALAKSLVELHGGSLAVESAPGAGSRFTISLPWEE